MTAISDLMTSAPSIKGDKFGCDVEYNRNPRNPCYFQSVRTFRRVRVSILTPWLCSKCSCKWSNIDVPVKVAHSELDVNI